MLLLGALLSPGQVSDPAPSPQTPSSEPTDQGNSSDPRPVRAIAIDDLARVVPSAIPLGERLMFKATVEWKGASVLVGHLELASWEDENSRKVLHARGRGQRFGYSIDQRIVSTMNLEGVRPVTFMNTQRGSEHHTKKLNFENGKISFSKKKHCHEEKCSDSSHLIAEVAWKGPIPWGTKEKHCEDQQCGNSKHEVWIHITDHEVEEPYVDLLTAIYIARTAAAPDLGRPLIIPVVNDDSRWYVEVTPQRTGKIQVEEGEYEAIEMALNPIASDGNMKKRFEGLFGIHGTLRVWFDSSTGRPVLIEGTLPFAYLQLKARIELISVGDAAVVIARHARMVHQESSSSEEGPR
ncbi:MAG: DUF3108 domain-containing protein [Planctomycetota bacterium]|nr:DUF3108 domain-containing protein [Planctomycetota bacterium]